MSQNGLAVFFSLTSAHMILAIPQLLQEKQHYRTTKSEFTPLRNTPSEVDFAISCEHVTSELRKSPFH